MEEEEGAEGGRWDDEGLDGAQPMAGCGEGGRLVVCVDCDWVWIATGGCLLRAISAAFS